MRPSDFKRHGITHFTPAEIEATGARLCDVETGLFVRLQRFRSLVKRKVILLPGGLTSGAHRAPEHAQGRAADITFQMGETPAIGVVFKAAMVAGFKGFGAYHNQFAYSFHLDFGDTYRFWMAWKLHGETQWHYESLFADPAERTTR